MYAMMLVGQVGWVSSDSVEGERERDTDHSGLQRMGRIGYAAGTPNPPPHLPLLFFLNHPSVIRRGTSIFTASVTKNSAPYPYPVCKNIN